MMRCHVLVRGKVQGVGFRWFVRERARSLGLAGRVRNRPDGAVEVEADGDSTSIGSLLADLQIGPAGAHVVDVEPVSPAGDPTVLPSPFTVER